MKYLPLIWSGIWRKPLRAILSLLAAIAAFVQFGMMVGLNETVRKIEANAQEDRIISTPRFGNAVPRSLSKQIESLRGVAHVGLMSFVSGYHESPDKKAFVLMVDMGMQNVLTDWMIEDSEWKELARVRNGLIISESQASKWKLHIGSRFTIAATQAPRADGATFWDFQVIGISREVPFMTNGFMIGNYEYLDLARPPELRGSVALLYSKVSDSARTAETAEEIDRKSINSGYPLLSTTEKTAFDINNSGIDVAALTRKISMAGLFMVLFLFSNGVSQAVRERFAELATLRALGYSNSSLVGLIFIETFLPCFIGAVSGVAVAAGLTAALPEFLPPTMALPIPTIAPSAFAWAILGALIITLLSTLVPLYRLLGMDIATALSRR